MQQRNINFKDAIKSNHKTCGSPGVGIAAVVLQRNISMCPGRCLLESQQRGRQAEISATFPPSDQLRLASQCIFFLDYDEKLQIICRYMADKPPWNEKDLIVLTASTKLIRPDCFCGWPSVRRGHYHPINADWCCDLQTPIQLHPTGARRHCTKQASAPQQPLSYFYHNRTGAVTHAQIFKKGQLEPRLQLWIKMEE